MNYLNTLTYIKHAFLIVLSAIGPTLPHAQEAQETNNLSILLKDGTPLHLILMDDLQGKKLHLQQVVHFKVRENLTIQNAIVVKTGTEVIGHVESVSKSGLLGRSGRLILQIDYVLTNLSKKINLRGGIGLWGGKGGALTGISATWYGPDASLPVGTSLNAYVNGDQQLQTSK